MLVPSMPESSALTSPRRRRCRQGHCAAGLFDERLPQAWRHPTCVLIWERCHCSLERDSWHLVIKIVPALVYFMRDFTNHHVVTADHVVLSCPAEVALVCQQPKASSKGNARLFSIMYLRRLTEQDAIQALEMWSRSPAANDVPAVELQSVQSRLRAAMRSTVPLWHVIVDSLGDAVDGYGKPPGFAVSTYFMQNMDELRELARQCLVEFLEEDKPDELEEAIQNPQFQEWARQWYLQSEDLSDVRSVRYMCRLPGCNVLLHCIRNDFGECCKLLLSRFSDQTRAQDWLVLAEPMRVFNQYEGISFHEAAYCGSTECLQALIDACQHVANSSL